MLETALEAEVAAYIERFKQERDVAKQAPQLKALKRTKSIPLLHSSNSNKPAVQTERNKFTFNSNQIPIKSQKGFLIMSQYSSGIDVSYAQGKMNWATAKAKGVSFAFARTSYGTSADNQFAANWVAMKNAGIIRGAYQFFVFSESAETQAHTIINLVKEAGGNAELPYVIDIEKYASPVGNNGVDATPQAERISKVKTWLGIVEKATGRKPMIYTSYYEWQMTLNSKDFGEYPLWVAADTSAANPLLPLGWSNWKFWQYSDGTGLGKQYGASSNGIDIDRFNGTDTDLLKYTQSAYDMPLTQPEQNSSMRTYTIKLGDTLYGIARSYKTTVSTLAQLNQITDPNDIDVGKILKIPK
jgi:GH25 family lysozyme M1 (1,4-beta-N-acetylmuramidase)